MIGCLGVPGVKKQISSLPAQPSTATASGFYDFPSLSASTTTGSPIKYYILAQSTFPTLPADASEYVKLSTEAYFNVSNYGKDIGIGIPAKSDGNTTELATTTTFRIGVRFLTDVEPVATTADGYEYLTTSTVVTWT